MKTQEQQQAGKVPVTVENFIRAESDLFFGNAVKGGGFGKFQHRREPMGIDDQFVVRGNRDTLYSIAVFDLDAAPVKITLPDGGKRFISLQIIDKDVPVDGFWSISLYNAEGYYEQNEYNANTLNNITAKKGANGSITRKHMTYRMLPNRRPTSGRLFQRQSSASLSGDSGTRDCRVHRTDRQPGAPDCQPRCR